MAVKDSEIVVDVFDTSRVGCVIDSAGAHSIGAAMDMLILGHADVMIAGGAEAAISPLTVDSYDCMSVLSHGNEALHKASRPFDLHRNGFVIAEGAGVLVLELWEAATARGAVIYAELKGYGMTCAAYSMAIPEPDGTWAAKAMEIALRRSRLSPDKIGYINAHGTLTQANDRIETLAIKRVFATGGAGLPPVSSNKSIGHVERGGCDRSCCHGAFNPPRDPPPDHQPGNAGPRVRPRLHPLGSAGRQDPGGDVQFLRIRGQNCALCFGRA